MMAWWRIAAVSPGNTASWLPPFYTRERWRVEEVGQWLHRAIEDQTDAQARGEEHGDPGEGGELGLRVVLAKSNLACRPEPHDQEEHQCGDHDRGEHPAEVDDDPLAHGPARFGEAFGRDDRPRQHGDGGSERYGEDRLVGLGLRVGVFDVDAWDQGWVDGALTAGGLRQGGAGSPGHRGLGFAAPGAFLVGALGGPLRAGSGFFHTPLCGCLFGWQAAGLSGTVGSFLTLARRNVK